MDMSIPRQAIISCSISTQCEGLQTTTQDENQWDHKERILGCLAYNVQI